MDQPHRITAILALLAAATVGGAWYATRGGQPPPVPTVAVASAGIITIHVASAVLRPGLVEVPRGARVADGIAAAGGAGLDADLRAVNLAAPLADGQQLRVPELSDGEPISPSDGGLVRVNVAAVHEIEQLPGVGPVLAARIVDHRDHHGPFTTVEDLLDVPGIGEGKLASLRESVLVP